jgi:hypothetical protein
MRHADEARNRNCEHKADERDCLIPRTISPANLTLSVFVVMCFSFSPSIIKMIKSRRMSWAGHVAHMREKTDAYRILVGKLEEQSPPGRNRRRWENNIKMDLKER